MGTLTQHFNTESPSRPAATMQSISRLPLLLPLLLLLLHTSQAKVSTCLSCNATSSSSDPDCAAGNADVPRIGCSSGTTDGCLVTKGTKDSVEVWMRSCCGSLDVPCADFHGDVEGVTIDMQSCDTDNCNTFDPSGGSSLASSLPVLLVSTFSIMLACRA